jgi:crossover junction endodeoxyribonuclease RusA
MIELYLPWPDSTLSPNNRASRFVKMGFEKAAKRTGYYIALDAAQNAEANDQKFQLPEVPLQLHYTFHPPDKRRRDDDNFTAMMKSYRDGIFEALGQDDSLVVRSIIDKADPVKGGKVILKISRFEND